MNEFDVVSDALRAESRRVVVPRESPDQVYRSVELRSVERVRRARRRARVAIGGGLAAAVVLVGVVVITRTSGDGEVTVGPDRTSGPVVSESPLPTPASIDPVVDSSVANVGTVIDGTSPGVGSEPFVIPPPPLEARDGAAIVSMGDDLFVWGGSVPYDDDFNEPPFDNGAIFDSSVGEWRRLPDAPIPGGRAEAVWVAGRVVVSSVAGSVATFDPATDTWREIEFPEPPDHRGRLQVLGDEAFLLPSAVALDPVSGETRQLGEPPAFGPESNFVGDGETVIAFGVPAVGGGPAVTARYVGDSDEWRVIPPGSLDGWYDASGLVADRAVAVSWEGMQVEVLDLVTETWSDLPPMPQSAVKCLSNIADVNGSIVVEMCGLVHVWLENESRWATFSVPVPRGYTDPLADGVLRRHAGGLLINGALIDTTQIGWYRRDVTIDGLRVSAELDAVLSATFDPFTFTGTVTAELRATGCRATVDRSQAVGNLVLFSDAAKAAAAGPPLVEWESDRGRYRLECPSADAYEQTFALLDVFGERTVARDVTAFFGKGRLIATNVWEAQVVGAVVADAQREGATAEVSWLGGGPGQGPFEYQLGVTMTGDQKGPERVYTVFAHVDGDNAVIDSVEMHYVCLTAVQPGDERCRQP